MRYDLVIFDNDGVLVDSEPISNTILAAYLTELGYPTSYEESIRDYMGSAMHRIHELVRERSGSGCRRISTTSFTGGCSPPSSSEPATRSRRRVQVLESWPRTRSRTAWPPPGAMSGSGWGIARPGSTRLVHDGRVFSSQDVGRGKPAPDLFLHAAERMGVALERCVVVEDSPLGRGWRTPRGWTCTGSPP